MVRESADVFTNKKAIDDLNRKLETTVSRVRPACGAVRPWADACMWLRSCAWHQYVRTKGCIREWLQGSVPASTQCARVALRRAPARCVAREHGGRACVPDVASATACCVHGIKVVEKISTLAMQAITTAVDTSMKVVQPRIDSQCEPIRTTLPPPAVARRRNAGACLTARRWRIRRRVL